MAFYVIRNNQSQEYEIPESDNALTTASSLFRIMKKYNEEPRLYEGVIYRKKPVLTLIKGKE